MRNLKKFLALVLALMMVVSVMVTVNAFNDSEDVSAKYAEAVTVLGGLDVLQGDPDGDLRPQDPISRAEMATIAYRITTGNTDATSPVIKNSHFSDVADSYWAAGFINACADDQLLVGYPDGTYQPESYVTGYEALTIVLRALGYGKAGELTGNDFGTNAYVQAQSLGMLTNIGLTDLSKPATRELVAEMAFQACDKRMVTYSVGLGYRPAVPVQTLVEKAFGDTVTPAFDYDEFARPSKVWKLNGKEIASVEVDPLASWNEPVSQCDIAAALDLTGSNSVRLYRNGIANVQNVTINATSTTADIGKQGQLTALYNVSGNPYIVEIDTFLAKVTDVTAAKYDDNDHMVSAASLTVDIYWDGKTCERTMTSPTNYTWTEDQYVLVNAKTTGWADTAGPQWDHGTDEAYFEVVGLATPVTAALTRVYSNGDRVIDGGTYKKANEFSLDASGGAVDKDTKYNWYFDQYGNVIGSTSIAAAPANYAVLKNIEWVNPGNLSDGYAHGTLVKLDGSEDVVTVKSINGTGMAYATTGATPGYDAGLKKWVVSTSVSENDTAYGGHWLFEVTVNSDGSVSLDNRAGETDIERTQGTTSGIQTGEPKITVNNRSGYSTDTEVFVNSETQFLVKTTNAQGKIVYTPYAGYLNVPNIASATVTDYVLNAGGHYAACVYVDATLATPGVSDDYKLIYVLNTLNYKDADEGEYIMTGVYVDGVNTAIAVEDPANFTAGNVYVANISDTVADNAAVLVDSSASYYTHSGKLWAKQFTVSNLEGTAFNGGANHWDIATATVYGANGLAGGTVKNGDKVVAVYTGTSDTDGTPPVGDHIVTTLYILP